MWFRLEALALAVEADQRDQLALLAHNLFRRGRAMVLPLPVSLSLASLE
jgi:hypothetical protein